MNAICRHFGACGGCAWQDISPENYAERKRRLIGDALVRHGIRETSLREIISVPPQSRRRATLKAQTLGGETRIGFHASRSHALIDISECHVLTPGLFRLAQNLRGFFANVMREGETADLHVVETKNGFDLAISCKHKVTREFISRIATVAPSLDLVRVTSGNALLYQSAVPEITFGEARVQLPPNAFLQPTREGEAILQAYAVDAIGKAKRIADIFSGCGTFTLPLAERTQVHAVDADAPMLAALAGAARRTSGLKPVTTETRDLFKLPLTPAELARFDAVVLDPPRAGARAQATMLAKSVVPRIAYISCDPASFARDAQVLIDGGFALNWIVGVDQFLWSAHIELAAAFSRK